MKTILKAAAMVLAMTTTAHAESWIIVVSSANTPANSEPFEAMIDPYIYNTRAQCWYKKGIWEGYATATHPEGQYNIWCAEVPGLVARK